MPRILVADSHGVYRKGLRGALEAAISDAQVLEADSLEAARDEFDPDGSLDLVLVDLNASGVGSLEALCAVHERYPKTRFAAMAALSARTDIIRSLEAGLHGFISKSQSDDEILDAIRDILSGRIYVPLSLARVDGAKARGGGIETYETPSPLAKTEARLDKLTRRQRELLPLLAKGMSNKEIARALKIAEGTTKIHASGLFRALGVRNRTEAVAVAQTRFANEHSISSNGSGLDRPSLRIAAPITPSLAASNSN